MREQRVIAIDPAPGKPTTVFDGAAYEGLSASELRDRIDQFRLFVTERATAAAKEIENLADPAGEPPKPPPQPTLA